MAILELINLRKTRKAILYLLLILVVTGAVRSARCPSTSKATRNTPSCSSATGTNCFGSSHTLSAKPKSRVNTLNSGSIVSR